MSSPINSLIGANLKHHASRYISTAIAVTIASTFVVLCLTLTNGLASTYTKAIEDESNGAVAFIYRNTIDSGTNVESFSQSEFDSIHSEVKKAVEGVEGVSSVQEVANTMPINGSNAFFIELKANATSLQRAGSIVNSAPFHVPDLRNGTLPENDSQIVIDKATAGTLHLSVGDKVQVRSYGHQSDYVDMTVSGIDTASMFTSGAVYMTVPGAYRVDPKASIGGFKVAAKDTSIASPATTSDAQKPIVHKVATVLGPINEKVRKYGIAFEAKASQKIVEDNRKQAEVQLAAMTGASLAFPLLAAFVASIIVGTTFQVIALQRRRELALLRAVGAQAKQVRTLIFRETSIAGVISSLIGVTVGSLIGAWMLVALEISGSFFSAFNSLPWVGIAITWLASSIITIFVGLRPSANASRVSPLAALAPVLSVQEEKKNHTIRFWFGMVLTVIGIAGTVYGWRLKTGDVNAITQRFLVMFGFCVLVWLGAMLVFSVIIPYVIYWSGSVLPTVVGRLARENVLRNPGRTASTGIAVIIGVVLMSTIAVGAASVRGTVLDTIDAKRPIDIMVTPAQGGSLTAEQESGLLKLKDFAKAAPIYGAVGIVDNDLSEPMMVQGYPNLDGISHSHVDTPADGEAMVAEKTPWANKKKIMLCVTKPLETGDSVAASGHEGSDSQAASENVPQACREYTVKVNKNLALYGVQISDKALKEMLPDASASQVVARIADGVATDTVTNHVSKIDSSLQAFGGAVEREIYTKAIDTVLIIFMALLGVSVVISLVGVANTLGLSVVERTHENGLLRALGLSRGQMRRLLIWEAFLISFVSTVVGVILGSIFGWVGINALPFNDLGADPKVVIPWDQVLGLFAVIVASSVLAAWIPGRTASKVSPVEALAHD